MSKLNLFYFTEKIEELRSRAALAYSSIRTLDGILLHTYRNFITEKEVPPFIYPKKQIESLSQELETLNSDINRISIGTIGPEEDILDVQILAFATQIGELESRSRDIFFSCQELSLALQQRIFELIVPDKLKYSRNLENEFTDSAKILEAIDALAYDLLEKTLGEDWILDKEFSPFAIISEKDYSINTETFVIRIPYHDCFRSRYWAILSHHTAHIFVSHYYSEARNQELRELVERNAFTLGKILQEIYSDTSRGVMISDPVFSQVLELICDAVACFVCGPAFFLSFCALQMLTLSYVPQDMSFHFKIGQRSHPPLFFRFLLMKKTLEHVGVLDVDKDLLEIVSSIENIAEFDVRYALKEFDKDSYPDLFTNYVEFIGMISDDILGFLDGLAQEGKIKHFGKHEFIKLLKLIRNLNLETLSPIEAINMVWMKRRVKIFEYSDLVFKNYQQKGKNDTEMLRTMVILCCNYFERIVFPKTMRYMYQKDTKSGGNNQLK